MKAGRAIHLIDIENQLGTGRIDSEGVTRFFGEYGTCVGLGPLDQVAVSSIEALQAVHLSSMRGCRLLFKPGHDGADLMLQEVMMSENIADRFERAICASGDGGFLDAVAYLTTRGVRVTVVSQGRSLAKRLRLAAHETIELRIFTIEKDAA